MWTAQNSCTLSRIITYIKTTVKKGLTSENYSEIIQGIAQNDIYVNVPGVDLKNGQNVKAIISETNSKQKK